MPSLSFPRLPIGGVVALLILPVATAVAQQGALFRPPSCTSAQQPMSQEAPLQSRPSAWFDADRRQFATVVEGLRTELFIAPVQVQNCGLDRSTRSLMGARVAMALSRRHGLETGNPYAIQRALGEGLRRIDATAIRQMATQANARKLVMLYAGHDRNSNLIVTAQAFRRNGDSPTWIGEPPIEFKSPIGESESVGEVFKDRILDRLVEAIQPGVPSKAIALERGALPRMPSTLTGMLDLASGRAIDAAIVYQLLGSLAPKDAERSGERFFELSMLALDRADPAGANASLLRARALLRLHSRPAALAALGKPETAAHVAFQAFLDGNLPELEAALPKVTDDFLRVLAEIDLRDLQRAYRLPVGAELPPALAALGKTRPELRALVKRRMDDGDGWLVQENVELKALLDKSLPIAGFDLESAVRGMRTIGRGMDPAAVGLLAFEHVRRLRASSAFLKSCALAKQQCPRAAFLDLVESLAVANASKAIVRAGVLQRVNEATDELVRTLSPEVDGHPQFALERARVALARLEGAPPDQRNRHMEVLGAQAAVAAYWEQGQSVISREAMVQMGVPGVGSSPFLDEYSADLPLRDFWFEPTLAPAEARIAFHREALRQATSNIDPAKSLVRSLREPERGKLKTELGHRFRGHPERAEIAVAPAPVAGASPLESRLAELASARRERPDLWRNHWNYGRTLFEDKGAYDEAAKSFLEFPGFRNRDGYNAVALSNNAYEAGSLHFWKGDYDNARNFYKISADLQTGSAASLASEARLAILDGKFEEAARLTFVRAQRYDDEYAYRDYLSWLFAFGLGEDAWAGFTQLNASLPNAQTWIAAHVGHRIARKSWPQLREWLMSDPIRLAGPAERYAMIQAVMLNTIDRAPAPDLAETLRKIEGAPTARWQAMGKDRGYVTLPDPRGNGSWVTMSSPGLRSGPLPPYKNDDPVPSPLVMFADAYVKLRRGEFANAAAAFDAMAQLYEIEGAAIATVSTSYALPYYAWAAAKSGNPGKLEAFLDGRQVPYAARFDHHLAKAFITGLRGEVEKSISHLDSAFNNRPFTQSRPILTEYQWAEACDWLYDATKNEKYRELALRWAKRNQRSQPFQSWSYAMEAKLAKSAADRTRALGFALYLDSDSERIARFSAAEKTAAKSWFDKNNPFRLGKGVKGRGSST